MKFSKIAATLLSMSCVSGAIAADFTGFGLAADMQIKSTDGQAISTDTSGGEDFQQQISAGGEQDVVGGLGLNFGFAVAPRVVLQVGATADLGKTSIYEVTQSLIDSAGVTTNSSAFLKEKNHYSIHLSPGYLLTPKTMLYAKFAYHKMKLDWSDASSGPGGTTQETLSNSFNGFGLGVGLQAMLTDHLYAYVEVQRVRYGRESLSSTATENFAIKPESSIGTIGIGYRF